MLNEKYKQPKSLEVSEITIDKFKDGALAKELPEVYELNKIIENGINHNNQSVFDHTLAVMKSLEILISQENQGYLKKMIDNKSKEQLLALAVPFHDINKKETLVEKDGKTSCLGHEQASAKKAENILQRFNLSPAEKDYIIRIISNHGRLHDLMSEIDREKLADEYEKIKIEISDIIYEIILFTEADMMGGDLKKNSPDEYNFRMNFYDDAIEKLEKL